MVDEHKGIFLSHIVYPDDIAASIESYWLIGWNIDQFKCIIACAIEKSLVSLSALEHAIKCVQKDESFLTYQFANYSCHPIVLGEWISEVREDYLPESQCQERGIWITLTRLASTTHDTDSNRHHHPKLHNIYSLGNRYDTSVYMLGFPRVDTNRLHSIALISNETPWIANNQAVPFNEESVSNLTELEVTIGLINFSQDLDALVRFYLNAEQHVDLDATADFINPKQFSIKRLLAAIGYVWYVWLSILQKIIIRSRPYLSYAYENLEWQELQLSSNNSHDHSSNRYRKQQHHISLETVSMCCLQFSSRANMLRGALRDTALFRISWAVHPQYRAHYWRNAMSIILYCIVDMLLGGIVGYFMFQHAGSLGGWMRQLASAFLTSFHSYLLWFNNSPGGVKLNPYVTRKVGGLLMYLMDIWAAGWSSLLVQSLQLPCIQFIACVGSIGLSFQVALILDILQLFGWPLAILNTLFAHQYRFHTQVVYSLWLLFKGQKNNVLRNRVDTCEYDQDLLPFGIVLFSIMLFLLPSMTVYYFYIALLQLGLTLVKYAAYAMLTLLKHIPYDSAYKRILWHQPIARVEAVELYCMELAREDTAYASRAAIANADATAVRVHITQPAGRKSGSTASSVMKDPAGNARSSISSQREGRARQLHSIQYLLQDMSPRSSSKQQKKQLLFEEAEELQEEIIHRQATVEVEVEAEIDEQVEEGQLPPSLMLPESSNESDSEMNSPSAFTSPFSPACAEEEAEDEDSLKLTVKEREGSPSACAGDTLAAPATSAEFHIHDKGETWSSLPSPTSSHHRSSLPQRCITTQMAFRFRRYNWRHNVASSLMWMHHLLLERKCIMQMCKMVLTIRPVRSRIIQATSAFDASIQQHADQQMGQIVRHLLSSPSHASREEREHVLEVLALDTLSFFQTLQLAADGSLLRPRKARQAVHSYQNAHKERYSRWLIWMLLLTMVLNMLSVLAGSVLFLWHLHTTAPAPVIVSTSPFAAAENAYSSARQMQLFSNSSEHSPLPLPPATALPTALPFPAEATKRKLIDLTELSLSSSVSLADVHLAPAAKC